MPSTGINGVVNHINTSSSDSYEISRMRKLPPLQRRRGGLLSLDAQDSSQVLTLKRQVSRSSSPIRATDLSMDDLVDFPTGSPPIPSQSVPISKHPSRSLSPEICRQSPCEPLDYNQWMLKKANGGIKSASRLSVAIPTSPNTSSECSPSPNSSNGASPIDRPRRISSPSIVTTARTAAKVIEPMLQRKRIRSAAPSPHTTRTPTPFR